MIFDGRRVRALLIDDSALIRKLLTMLLAADPEIEVVGTAADPYEAREKIKALNPDVVTLDVEMPRMDGLSFLEKIMTLRPMPVIMVSSLTQANADITIKALEIGAVDFLAKPSNQTPASLEALGGELCEKVKAAARIRFAPKQQKPAPQTAARSGVPFTNSGKIIFVGASTGGVEAVRNLLSGFPENCPPTLITQHMPERFTQSFAARLDTLFPIKIVEAVDEQPVEGGHVYIAPGGWHMEIVRRGTGYICRLNDGPLVSGHRPSVDFLFNSAARVVKNNAVGVILTGMGKDGAAGLLEMRKAGAYTLGQDEASSLIYGMPREAFQCGAVMRQVPLSSIADAALAKCSASQLSALRRQA